MNREYIEEITLLPYKYMLSDKKSLNEDMIFLGREYWTNSIIITNSFYGYKNVYLIAPQKEGSYHGYFHFNNVDAISGVRPVIKVNNLDKAIRECPKNYENDLEVIKCGEFPDFDKPVEVSSLPLLKAETFYLPENIKDPKTGKVNNNNFHLETTPIISYFYEGKKIAEYKGKYYEVKPIDFLVDRENNMLISKKILFDSILDVDLYDSSYCIFSKTLLYKYLNHDFINYLSLNNKETITKQEENAIIKKIQSLLTTNENLKAQILQNKEILELLQNQLEESNKNQKNSTVHSKVLKR